MAFLRAALSRLYFLAVGLVFALVSLYERVTHKEVSVPPWVTWAAVAVGLLIACIGAYRDLANRDAAQIAALNAQLGHRIREDFRAGVDTSTFGGLPRLVLQKYSFDTYAALVCVVTSGPDRWESEEVPDPGNASGYGSPAAVLFFPSDFTGPASSPTGRIYEAVWTAKRRVGELSIESTEVARLGFTY